MRSTKTLMEPLAKHIVLVSAESCSHACRQVREFFSATSLVRYDKIEISEEHCCSAGQENFSNILRIAIESNRDVLNKLVEEFKDTGCHSIDDLQNVQHGYPSKVLHIITHFLDGFIGIDTRFYNLIDDSHWIPAHTNKAIANSPLHHWLITVNGFSATPERAALIHK